MTPHGALADAGLAADDERPRAARHGRGERREPQALVLPADEAGGGTSSTPHDPITPPRTWQRYWGVVRGLPYVCARFPAGAAAERLGSRLGAGEQAADVRA